MIIRLLQFPFLPVLLSFMAALLILLGMLRSGFGNIALDHPNQRSLHAVPVPRTGGLALMGGMLAGWGLLARGWLWPVVLIAVLLGVVSFLDDTRGLPVRWRLAAHFLAACALMLGVGTEVGPLAMLIAVPATVWMVNLYNFMDGSDGLAGGMALLGFGFYGLAAWLGGQPAFALANLIVAAAAGAFLLFNFHPARIFMGDAGSIPLGFLAAALGFLGWQRGIWAPWFPPLVFSPFVVDASVTLVKRLLRGEKVWQAHRGHYYQRLVRMGAGHRNTAMLEYVLMTAAGGSSVWAAGQGGTLQAAFLLAWVLVYGGLLGWIDARWGRFNRQGDHA